MKSDAVFSSCRAYRYVLSRIWDDTKPIVMIVGLNPSTADEKENDPTVTRCINFAKSWGYGGIYMTNLFAYRATIPDDMMAANDPVGSENDMWLQKVSDDAGLIIAAWGNKGGYLKRSTQVKEIIPELHCIKMNKSGEPAHPLYLKGDLKPIPINI